MGLFDRRKNKAKKEENNITPENTQLKTDDAPLESKNVQSTNEDGEAGRFFVVVEDVTTMLGGTASIVIGDLTGSLKKGDTVYIYQVGVQPVSCQILGVEKNDAEGSTITEEASDTTVSLQIDIPEDYYLRKYAVITNVSPKASNVGSKPPVENPALEGIINGMEKHGKDNSYHATVAYWVSHARFITPIKIDNPPEMNEGGVAALTKDTQIGFYMLQSLVRIAGTPEGQESMVLPLFTDWKSLDCWRSLKKGGEKVHTQVISFQDLYAMLKSAGAYAGIAINPFNKVPCTLPIPYLDTIVGTTGYKNDFGEAAVSAETPEETVDEASAETAKQVDNEEEFPEGKKILLAVPKQNEETTAIRSKLLEYGQRHEDICSIAFLTKVESDTQKACHLVALEFPDGYTDAEMRGHMQGIYKELKPVIKEIKQIEYAIKGRVKAIDEVVAQHKEDILVYSK